MTPLQIARDEWPALRWRPHPYSGSGTLVLLGTARGKPGVIARRSPRGHWIAWVVGGAAVIAGPTLRAALRALRRREEGG